MNKEKEMKLSIGIVFGLILGIVFGSILLGLIIGTCFGLVWGYADHFLVSSPRTHRSSPKRKTKAKRRKK